MGFRDLTLTEQLLIARRGTSYFAQRLGELSDEQLDGRTLLAGWSRKHLLAHVGYNAAALCRLMDWAATGNETPMYESACQRAREIDEGATLNASALRNLFGHSVARLDERWRHLPAAAWSAEVLTAQGRVVPASETIWMRTREVWIHAVDLANDGRFGDFPGVVNSSLLEDVMGMWKKAGTGVGLLVAVVGDSPRLAADSKITTTVTGELPAVTRWATGRGSVGVDIEGEITPPPRWL